MQHSPSWEANRFSASQVIPHILWNPKVPYRILKCPPTVPLLTQLESIHNHTSHFLKIPLNIILPSMPGSLSLMFPHKTLYTSLLSPYSLHAPPISFFSECFRSNNSTATSNQSASITANSTPLHFHSRRHTAQTPLLTKKPTANLQYDNCTIVV